MMFVNENLSCLAIVLSCCGQVTTDAKLIFDVVLVLSLKCEHTTPLLSKSARKTL